MVVGVGVGVGDVVAVLVPVAVEVAVEVRVPGTEPVAWRLVKIGRLEVVQSGDGTLTAGAELVTDVEEGVVPDPFSLPGRLIMVKPTISAPTRTTRPIPTRIGVSDVRVRGRPLASRPWRAARRPSGNAAVPVPPLR